MTQAADYVHIDRAEADHAFYRLDGSWSCTKDGVTRPCGDCDGCHQVAAENRNREADRG